MKETISYFIDTTGLSPDNFILLVQKNSMKDESVLNYNEWLAVKSFKFLKSHDVSLADCLDFRNLATQLKFEKRGINVSPLWKKEIAALIEKSNVSNYTLLEVSDKNITAYLLYKKLGFAERRIRKNYYKDGTNAIEMFKAVN